MRFIEVVGYSALGIVCGYALKEIFQISKRQKSMTMKMNEILAKLEK